MASLEHEFVENVDLQNVLFEANCKFHKLAYGECKLLLPIWSDKPECKPKIVDFITETTGKIKAIHAAKKRQQIAALAIPPETTKESKPSKVCFLSRNKWSLV